MLASALLLLQQILAAPDARHPESSLKPSDIAYACPDTIDEVVRLLSEHKGSAKIISGGQSLMPILAFRMADIDLAVDLRRVGGLDAIVVDDGGVTLGSRVRWRDIEHDPRLTTAHPLLCAAVGHVAHYQIRNRGTVGGSLAHADPAAELPAVAVTCGAEVEVLGPAGRRTIPAESFFLGPLSTALEPADVITSLRLPPWRHGRRFAFEEFSRRLGDFAMAGVALCYDIVDGRIAEPRIGGFGVADVPIRLFDAEAALARQEPGEAVFERAVSAALACIAPEGDIHADGEYRRALFGTLLGRALQKSLT